MTKDILDDFLKRMDTPEFKESIRSFVQEQAAKRQKMRDKVSSKEYIHWVYDYVTTNKRADDEGALYVYKGIDSEYGQLLSWFMEYVKELAQEQGAQTAVTTDSTCMFGNEQVVIKIRDRCFSVFTMYGQGSWTNISLLGQEHSGPYVQIEG